MHEVDIKSLQLNPWSLIGDRWMLITAGNKEDGFNTMTAAWGHFGTLFGSREEYHHLLYPTPTLHQDLHG